jgi:hypothetical protein
MRSKICARAIRLKPFGIFGTNSQKDPETHSDRCRGQQNDSNPSRCLRACASLHHHVAANRMRADGEPAKRVFVYCLRCQSVCNGESLTQKDQRENTC